MRSTRRTGSSGIMRQFNLKAHQHGLGHVGLEDLKVLAKSAVIHDATVSGNLDSENVDNTHVSRVVSRADELLATATHSHNGGVRRANDGSEVINAKHTEVGHSKGATLELLELELVAASAASEVFHVSRDLHDTLLVGVLDDRCNETSGCSNGNCNVYGRVLHNRSVRLHAAVDGGHITKSKRGCLEDHVVDRRCRSKGSLELLAHLKNRINFTVNGGIKVRARLL
mmetsp:Transcript_5257/g.10885  ORF Transcript_5257/g.10885 Transcript_5257/m.10885 type:complete len:227 (+) Transcript_5257:946-1626(+)